MDYCEGYEIKFLLISDCILSGHALKLSIFWSQRDAKTSGGDAKTSGGVTFEFGYMWDFERNT